MTQATIKRLYQHYIDTNQTEKIADFENRFSDIVKVSKPKKAKKE